MGHVEGMSEQPSNPSQPPQMSLTGMLALQGGVLLLALVLDMAFGLRMLDDLAFSLSALNWGIVATIPLLLGVWLLGRMGWAWVAELQQFMLEIIVPLFRKTPAGVLFAVSLLAGVGEELLFRGVIQGGLDGVIGNVPALVVASVVFGAMHALSRAYFLVATAMGFYLGWLYLATGNLLIPVVVHFLYDWIVLRYYLKGR
jgi:membrane protease YdiL (CAAX protease family)